MYGEFLSPQISDVKIYLLKYDTLAREFLIMDMIDLAEGEGIESINQSPTH